MEKFVEGMKDKISRKAHEMNEHFEKNKKDFACDVIDLAEKYKFEEATLFIALRYMERELKKCYPVIGRAEKRSKAGAEKRRVRGCAGCGSSPKVMKLEVDGSKIKLNGRELDVGDAFKEMFR